MPEPEYPDPGTRNVIAAGCSRCPALVESRERIAWGNGSTDADLVVVGEAPGGGDPDAERWRGGNYTGLAYTARHSGRVVRALLEDLGFGPDDVYVTNAVKCHPEGNRDPTDGELDACFAHLRAELDAVDPVVVATTGRHATRVLLDREGFALEGFLDAVLDPIDCPGLGVTVLPLLHPAYQHVWRPRLGFETRAAYVDAVGEALAPLGDGKG
ncbi:MAG: uracil-DNA glycosylase family protein [Halobacteriales archaeon]